MDKDDALEAVLDSIQRGYDCAKNNPTWTEAKALLYAQELFPSLSNAVFIDEEWCIALFMKGFQLRDET